MDEEIDQFEMETLDRTGDIDQARFVGEVVRWAVAECSEKLAEVLNQPPETFHDGLLKFLLTPPDSPT